MIVLGLAISNTFFGAHQAGKFADEVRNGFAKKVMLERGMPCTKTGSSMPRFNIKSLEVGFRSFSPLSVEEARKLEVELTEEFREYIQDHQGIQPYLRYVPADQSVARVSIAYYGTTEEQLAPDAVVHVFQARGKLHYSTSDPNSIRLYNFHEETYEEALRIVAEQKAARNK